MNPPFPDRPGATPPTGTSRSGSGPALLCDASALSVLAFGGPDAREFLHGQLSSDVHGLRPGEGHWTTYNSPKGRMLANGFLWRAADEAFRLALSADVAAPVGKRLRMFVLRSKVALEDWTASHARIGVAGDGALDAVRRALGDAPAASGAIVHDGLEAIALPDGRVLLAIPEAAAAKWRARLAGVTEPGDAQAWTRAGILAGTPFVGAATQDLLLPQSANMDVLGGVVLTQARGCFPGQEIIKRTQAIAGMLKERLYAFEVETAPPAPGTRIYGATYGEQACGVVVQSAGDPAGPSSLLASVQVRAAQADVLHLGAPDGPALAPRALPYEVPSTTVTPRGAGGAPAPQPPGGRA